MTPLQVDKSVKVMFDYKYSLSRMNQLNGQIGLMENSFLVSSEAQYPDDAKK